MHRVYAWKNDQPVSFAFCVRKEKYLIVKFACIGPHSFVSHCCCWNIKGENERVLRFIEPLVTALYSVPPIIHSYMSFFPSNLYTLCANCPTLYSWPEMQKVGKSTGCPKKVQNVPKKVKGVPKKVQGVPKKVQGVPKKKWLTECWSHGAHCTGRLNHQQPTPPLSGKMFLVVSY